MKSDGAVSDSAQNRATASERSNTTAGRLFMHSFIYMACSGWLTVSLFSEIHDKAMAKSIKIPPKINGK
jgi:hypothetical protein